MSLKYRIISAFTALLITLSFAACGNTQTSAIDNGTTVSGDTTEPSENTTEHAVDDMPGGENEEKNIRSISVISLSALIPNTAIFDFGEKEISISSYDFNGSFISLDKRYTALTSCTVYRYEDGSTERKNICINILDNNEGHVVASFPLDADNDLDPTQLYSVTEDGYVLHAAEYDPMTEAYRERFYVITLNDGKFSMIESDTYTGNRRFYVTVSPDGKHTAYREYIPSENLFGLFIEDGEGNVTLVAKDRPENQSYSDGLWLSVKPQGFIDNDTFIYNLFYEGVGGYGIYKLSENKNTEFDKNYEVFSIIDGVAYAAEKDYAGVISVGAIDRDGEYTKINVPEQYHDLIFVNSFDIITMCGGKWVFTEADSESIYVFPLDFSTMAAKIDLPDDRRLKYDFTGEDRLTITFEKKQITEDEEKIDDISDIASLLSMNVQEIRDKYGDTTLESSTRQDPRKYVLRSERNLVITFEDWHSRSRNGYSLNAAGYLYPSYITVSAENTEKFGIAHGDSIDTYAPVSSFESVYCDHRGEVYITFKFENCLIKLRVDPGWGSSFASSTQAEKDAEFEKYKTAPYGTVMDISFYPSDELKAQLNAQKKEEINEDIFALLDMTPSAIVTKYGELSESCFENVTSYVMHTPDRLDGVNLVYSQAQPSESELPREIVINEYFDRSFLGMRIGENVAEFIQGKNVTDAWYDEDIGCCLSFEEDGYTVTVVTGGEGSTGERGSDEWKEDFKENPVGYIRAVKAEKQSK